MSTKIAAVIPAYNEEKTIGNVLEALSKSNLINEIIVVSDGSKDKTAEIAKIHKARVIELKKNQGKTNAVITGVRSTDAEIIVMLDADLVGLKHDHIMALLQPIFDNKAEMTVGIFKSGRGATDLAQKIAPFLSGQRAILKSVFDRIENYDVKDYGIEIALTLMAEKEKIKVKQIYLSNLTHVMKEEKMGFFIGLIWRIKMYWDILFSLIKLKLKFN